MRIDVQTGRPVLRNNVGGLSGPALLPVAVRAVYLVRRALPDMPILGMGGITTGRDAAELMLAGANAVAVGTALFKDPKAPVRISKELAEYCESRGAASVSELTGAVEPW
jgi:dihydroorotate dehydrogenase (NAD+) catalytic subunit